MEIYKCSSISSEDNPIYAKLILGGTTSVGKSFLLSKIQSYYNKEIEFAKLDKNYTPTIGVDPISFGYKINNHLFRAQIWDISGQERFKDKIYYYARGALSILLLYNSFDRDSFNGAIETYINLYKLYPNSIYVLIRSKYDLDFKNENKNNDFVSDEEALEFTEKNNIIFSHISCYEKYEDGIKELFETIFLKYLKKIKI